MSKEFKPAFDGYMKMFLHDSIPERLASRAVFTGKWVQSKRHSILKNKRRFSIRLHIFDTDGHKRGHTVFDFVTAGGQKDLSKAIVQNGNIYIDELKAEIKEKYGEDLQVDLTNSYAIIRA